MNQHEYVKKVYQMKINGRTDVYIYFTNGLMVMRLNGKWMAPTRRGYELASRLEIPFYEETLKDEYWKEEMKVIKDG